MSIRAVTVNNRRRAFEVETSEGVLDFPYARLRLQPTPENRIEGARVDAELGGDAFTYVLTDGTEDSVALDAVLEYNDDPGYLRNLLLYKLTLEAQRRAEATALSKREMSRRLGTSASQLYRLLDQTNYRKSVGQMLSLLHVLGCEVELVVKDAAQPGDEVRRGRGADGLMRAIPLP